jgi:hypothetical protein
MSSIKTEYSANTAMTITLTSLASSTTAGRESTFVDNTTDRYLDVLIQGKIKPQNSGSISGHVYVFAYGSTDGTDFPDKITGVDAAITFDATINLKLLGTIYVTAINVEYSNGPWSVAALYGGRLPSRWGIAVMNSCGTAFSSTPGDHVFEYQGVTASVA